MNTDKNLEFVPIKVEFMKPIVWFVCIASVSALTNAYALMWYTQDLSSLGEITLGVVGWFTAVIGFYTWKAKKDHEMGYRHGYYRTKMSINDVLKMTSGTASDIIGEEEYNG